MTTIHDALNAAIRECTTARSRISKIRTNQVRGVDDIASLRATAETWFHSHRPVIVDGNSTIVLTEIDDAYRTILDLTEKHATKGTYGAVLKTTKETLLTVRGFALALPEKEKTLTDDSAPDFAPLVGDEEMRLILAGRWDECVRCVKVDAHLAAIVMMGGLLEALFVARANKLSDKSPLITATSAPKEKSSGKTANYQEWMLDSYIKVGRELGWITESAKDIADVLKEFRNFVHPAKQLRLGITLGFNDSALFWEVTKQLSRQLLLSV